MINFLIFTLKILHWWQGEAFLFPWWKVRHWDKYSQTWISGEIRFVEINRSKILTAITRAMKSKNFNFELRIVLSKSYYPHLSRFIKNYDQFIEMKFFTLLQSQARRTFPTCATGQWKTRGPLSSHNAAFGRNLGR